MLIIIQGIVKGSWVVLVIILEKTLKLPHLVRKLGHRPSFRHIRMRSFGRIPVLGNIKITITTAVFGHILGAVNTGANNVLIQLSVPGGQPAGTAHISVAFPVQQKSRQQIVDQAPVFVEKVPFGFLGFL
jgi:hypothetical protein